MIVLALLTAGTFAGPAFAEEFEIKMLNKGENGAMVFEPDFVKVAIGDTIKFVPIDKGHNVETIKGMLPEGFEQFKTKFGDEYVFTAQTDGVYGIKCSPHYGMGMIALIAVGEPTNLEEAKAVAHKGQAKKRFAEAFTKLEGKSEAPASN
jgi:pseudoazurin